MRLLHFAINYSIYPNYIFKKRILRESREIVVRVKSILSKDSPLRL